MNIVKKISPSDKPLNCTSRDYSKDYNNPKKDKSPSKGSKSFKEELEDAINRNSSDKKNQNIDRATSENNRER